MLKIVSPDNPAREIDEILEEDGCIAIERLADPEALARIAGELAPYFERAQFGTGIFVGHQTKRLGSVLRKSGSAIHLMTAPAVLAAMSELLLPNCERFQLNLSQAVAIYPGSPAQILHRDDELFPGRGFAGEYMANAIWALDPFTRENGGTVLVPGSHKWDREREPQASEIVHAEIPAGSVLIWRGSLLHGGGANESSTPRRGIIFSYNLGWLRQGENQYLAYPPDVARYLPEPVQQLIGYTVHRPNVGQYECNDPQRLLTRFWRDDAYESHDFLTQDQEALARAYAQ